MSLAFLEHAARLFEPKPDPYPTPGELAQAITPGTIQTPALDVIDQALVEVEEGRCDRLIISMPPQVGKSTRVTKTGPLWFLLRHPERRIVVASYAESLAQEFGRDIRTFISLNQGQDDTLDLGPCIAPDNGAVTPWKLDGHLGGRPLGWHRRRLTGRPAALIGSSGAAGGLTCPTPCRRWWSRRSGEPWEAGEPREAPRRPCR
ncbi:hypothetical protein [Puerhibacterium sp. TATVAM-FAB25]|uniref:hypothetical protein n=1 Tax=Puerhibacterium sp. TATVAM-FAB25 TaxID=3093699 RepID=UPI00397C4227